MKIKFLLTLSLICFSCQLYSQSPLDIALDEISSDIASKLAKKDKKKVVVLYVTDINKSPTTAGKYIADYISVHIVNNEESFMVFDRDNLKEIIDAKKLVSEGYIDVENVKELGRMLAVDVIIVGNYTVMNNTIKLTIKGLDSNTGFVIAASMKDLPLDNQSSSILGINVSGNTGLNENRGFNNTPLNSGEQYNNPETVNKECVTKNTGDFCFTNGYSFKVKVSVFNNSWQTMILAPGQTQCFYNFKCQSCNYKVISESAAKSFNGLGAKSITEGQILIEQCKSKTMLLK